MKCSAGGHHDEVHEFMFSNPTPHSGRQAVFERSRLVDPSEQQMVDPSDVLVIFLYIALISSSRGPQPHIYIYIYIL